MLLPIRLYTDPLLSTTCATVTDFTDPKLEELVQNMVETMLANNGVGLAANQVGIPQQLAILYVENKTKIMTIINPVIIGLSKEKDKRYEGCLSCPGATVPVKRHLGVKLECQNLQGEKVQYEFTNFDARILQHEFKHLQGITIAHDTLKPRASVI